MLLSCKFLAYKSTSKEEPQAEFHLSRRVGLASDHAKASRTIDTQRWVGWLKMVQNVQELEAERGAHALPDADIFGDSQIKVERSEAAENTGAAAIGVDTQN